MINPEKFQISKEREFEPEEKKTWPEYIIRRFEALNLAHDLEIERLEKLVKQYPSIDHPYLWIYLAKRMKEESRKIKIEPKLSQKLVEKLFEISQNESLNWDFRKKAIYVLGEFGEIALKPLEELVKDEKPPDVRKTAAYALGKLGEIAFEALEKLSQDEDPLIRAIVADALGQMGKRGFETLKKLAKDESKMVREVVADSLGNLGEIALEPLQELIQKDESESVRKKAISGLGKLGKVAFELLKELAQDQNNPSRTAAISALSNLGEMALEPLRELALAKHEETKVRKAAIYALGNLKIVSPEPLLEPLRELALTKDEKMDIREAAIHALGKIGPAALGTLKELARDENGLVRSAVALALGSLGEFALESLKELAEDKTVYVRTNAIFALGNLGPIALETLKEVVRKELEAEKDSWVLMEAAESLGKMGEEALGFLEELLRYENERVRNAVFSSIGKIKAKQRKDFLKSLVIREEPFLANPHLESIYNPEKEEESPILKLYDIVEELMLEVSNFQKENPSLKIELIGLSILGSFSKGYWIPGSSDIDWGLIWNADSENAVVKMAIKQFTQKFKEKVEILGFKLCVDHSVNIAFPQTQEVKRLEILFNGLFLGNRNGLNKARAKIIESLTPEKWEEIRKCWSEHLENYTKMITRFQLAPQDVERVKCLREFLWGLPDYETAKEIFLKNNIY